MSTGYSCEGIRQVCVTLLGVCHVPERLCGDIRAWLSDRWQQVCVSGEYSARRRVTSGVPQGSVLGPIFTPRALRS